MDFSHYMDYPVQLAMELVNTRSPIRGQDRLTDIGELSEFVKNLRDEWIHPDWRLTQNDLDETLQLRSQLRLVFGVTTDVEAATVLNEILESSGAAPRVSLHSGHPHLHFEPDGGSLVAWIGSLAATGIAMALDEHGLDRLGTCADSERCGHVFIDTSRNRSKRFCSERCSTRSNVQAHRSRRKAAGSGQLSPDIAD